MTNSIMNKKSLIASLIYILSFLSIILIIQICSIAINNDLILPSVGNIFSSFFKLLGNIKTYQYILKTLWHLIISLLLATIIGATLGILAGVNKYIRMFLKPWITIFRSIPLASAIVLIMIISGLTKTPYIICVFMTISIIYESFCKGIQSLSNELMDVWKMDSKINAKIIFRVHLPLISPHIRIALINALGIGIKVIIMAEYIVGSKGTLGGAINYAINQLDYANVYAYSIIMITLVLLLEYFPKILIYWISYLKINHINKKKSNYEIFLLENN